MYSQQLEGIGECGGVVEEDLEDVVGPDGGVGQGEHPAGQVTCDCGVAHVGNLKKYKVSIER